MDPGLPEDGLLEVPDELVVGVAEGQVGLDALPDDGIGEGVGNGFPLVLVDKTPGGRGRLY